MLSSLEIGNFKGIKSGKIGDLAQVNVLVGRNNSGKSTVLDALLMIRYAFVQLDLLGQDALSQVRDRKVTRDGADYRGLAYLLNTDDPVVLTTDFGESIGRSRSGQSDAGSRPI